MQYAFRWSHLLTVDCHLVRLYSTTRFWICLLRSLSVSSALVVSFIGEQLGRCQQGWMDEWNAAGRNVEATGLIHCISEGIIGTIKEYIYIYNILILRLVQQFLSCQLKQGICRRLQHNVPSPLS